MSSFSRASLLSSSEVLLLLIYIFIIYTCAEIQLSTWYRNDANKPLPRPHCHIQFLLFSRRQVQLTPTVYPSLSLSLSSCHCKSKNKHNNFLFDIPPLPRNNINQSLSYPVILQSMYVIHAVYCKYSAVEISRMIRSCKRVSKIVQQNIFQYHRHSNNLSKVHWTHSWNLSFLMHLQK